MNNLCEPALEYMAVVNNTVLYSWVFPGGSVVKNLLANAGDPLEKGVATHSSILAWRIPWTEEPGRLQSKGSQKSET